MRTRRLSLMLLLLPLSLPLAACGGCGGDDGDDTAAPDAPIEPDAGVGLCAELVTPLETVDSYPAFVTGDVIGEGADIRVEDGVCDVEDFFADEYFDPIGEDTVVALTGLEAGVVYGVRLDSP